LVSDVPSLSASALPFIVRPAYRWYVLGLLTLIYFVSYVDRQILAILLQSIKEALLLSDWQLGALSGLAFALFYTTLGVPIAWAADRFNRRNIIAVSIMLWSLMTALCGMAHNFLFLFLARLGVGIGEAGCNPPSHSILSDYFAARERAMALAILGTGSMFAALVGFAGGGLLNELVGWRNTFIIVGLPGVAVGLLALFTLREPPRGHADRLVDTGLRSDFSDTLRTLFGMRIFIFLSAAGATQSFIGNSIISWLPAFFERSHHLTSTEIGYKLGLAVVVGGIIGIVGAGFIADRLAKRDVRWYAWVGVIGLLTGTPCVLYTFVSPNADDAFLSFALAAGLLNAPVGPLYTMTQGIAPLHMRASASALLLMTVNLIGLGLGPLTVGALSDLFEASHGADSLKLALTIVSFVPFFGALFFWLCARDVRQHFVNALSPAT
jgi:MFS family permease